MPSSIQIKGFRIGESIRIQDIKLGIKEIIYAFTVTELFFGVNDNAYVFIQSDGEVSFANCTSDVIQYYLQILHQHIVSPVLHEEEFKEELMIYVDANQPLKFDYNSISIPEVNADVIKIVMLNVNQSVVLDFYNTLSQQYLNETSYLTKEMELFGQLKISGKTLMKFIGKTQNTQNRIIDNLYFLDTPELVWEDEYVSQINAGLMKVFQLKIRFKEIEYTLKIIDNNLRTFTQLVYHRDNSKLEIVIIVLILFEFINALINSFW